MSIKKGDKVVSHIYKMPLITKDGEEVVKVDYIESSGTQYIDTGFYPTGDVIKTYIKFVNSNVSQHDKSLFGAFKTSGAIRGGYIYTDTSASKYGYRFAWGSSDNLANAAIDDNIVEFELERNFITKVISLSVNAGIATTYINNSASKITYNEYLFCANANGSPNWQSSIKCYGYKVIEDDVIVRDFIPVKYGSEYCMLDLVENKLYHNKGTGSFSGGGRVEVKEITKIFIENGVRYAYLDYIGTTGTQYINLGNYQTESAKDVIETKFRFESLSSSTSTTYWLWNNQVSASAITSVSDFYSQANKFMFRFGSNASQSAMLTFPHDRNVHTLKVDGINRKVYFDGTVYGFPFSGSTGNVPFNLFRRITGVGYGSVYLYLFKITKNGVTKFDLIPAIRLSDNVKGLFDRSSKTFYTNSGTGTFLGNIKKIVLGGD